MRSYILNRGEKLHAEKCKLKDKSGLGRVCSVHKRRMGVKDQGRVGEGGGGGEGGSFCIGGKDKGREKEIEAIDRGKALS